jgi:YesN/AraC family two-component response regulator
MIVDDDVTVVDGLKTLLKNRGYEAIGAHSGRGCLDKLRREGADVVFLDIRMPEMDGIEALKEIKRMSPSTYIVMMTAFATVDTAVEAMKDGAFDYVRKPFKLDDVKTSILNILEEIKFEKTHRVITPSDVIKLKNCFEFFKSFLRKGVKGLCISGEEPKSINKKHGLKNVENVWVTEKAEGAKVCVNPKKLDELKSIIENFTSKNKNVPLLICDLDFLIKQNSWEAVKGFLQDLNEKIRSRNTTLILSADPGEMEKEELEKLQSFISDLPVRLIFEATSSPMRRKIILLLDRQKKSSFTAIGKEIGITDSPKLSFHLRKLKECGMIEQDQDKNYSLTWAGSETAVVLLKMGGRKGTLTNIMWVPKNL